MYYGCCRKTSPNYVRATFENRKYAELWISCQKNPNDWKIVKFGSQGG